MPSEFRASSGVMGATRNGTPLYDFETTREKGHFQNTTGAQHRSARGAEFAKGNDPLKIDKPPTSIPECPEITDAERGRAIRLRGLGWSVVDIADELGIDRGRINQILAESKSILNS